MSDAITPDTVITLTVQQFAERLHLIRHEHGNLWPFTDGCGCMEIATTVALDSVECDDCGLAYGQHNFEVEH